MNFIDQSLIIIDKSFSVKLLDKNLSDISGTYDLERTNTDCFLFVNIMGPHNAINISWVICSGETVEQGLSSLASWRFDKEIPSW